MEGRAGVAIGDDDLHSAGAVDDWPDAALILIPAQHMCNELTANLSRHEEPYMSLAWRRKNTSLYMYDWSLLVQARSGQLSSIQIGLRDK